MHKHAGCAVSKLHRCSESLGKENLLNLIRGSTHPKNLSVTNRMYHANCYLYKYAVLNICMQTHIYIEREADTANKFKIHKIS